MTGGGRGVMPYSWIVLYMAYKVENAITITQ